VGDPTDLMEAAMQAMAASGVRLGELPDDLWRLDDFLDRPDSEMSEWCVPGLIRNSWRVVVVAGEGVGKLIRLDEPVPTPSGWSTVGDLRVGDELFDLRGDVCRVTALSPIDLKPETYAITFSDGVVIEACADHRWMTCDYRSRRPNRRGGGPPATWPMEVRTTKEILRTLKARNGHVSNHAIPVAGAIQCPPRDLPVDPYLLGVWLGDGDTSSPTLTLNDDDAPQILKELTLRGVAWRLHKSTVDDGKACRRYGLLGFGATLRENGLWGEKHIPPAYLRCSEEQRLDLLRGLMDTDGFCPSVSPSGRGGGSTVCELTFTCEPLARGAVELVRSLGMAARIKESDAKIYGRVVSRRWRITFVPDRAVFLVSRKRDRQILPIHTYRSQLRYIVSVEPCAPSPMRCITVDSEDHTFLVSEHFIPTVNTVLFRQVAIAAAQGIHPLDFNAIKPCRTLIVDLENPEDSVMSVCNPIRERVKNNLTTEYDPDRAWLWHRPSGINLRNRADRIAFESIIARVRPDLVCLGPLYKAYDVSANENDELAAKEVMKVLDVLRSRYSFGLLMEHHAPKESSGSKRKMMPYGSSLWMRWPEIGLGLTPEGEGADTLIVGRWRGDRLENSWPEKLHRSLTWPWQGEYKDNHFKRPQAPPPKLRPPEMTDLDDLEPPPRDRGELDDYDDQFPYPEEPF